MYNKVILMGRLTADPELRQTSQGVSVCSFTIAVDRSFSKSEERQADFFRVTAWRNNADFVSKFFAKGKMAIVEGRIQNNNYTDSQGITHRTCEIQADNVMFGETKAASELHSQNAGNYGGGGNSYGNRPQNNYTGGTGYNGNTNGYNSGQFTNTPVYTDSFAPNLATGNGGNVGNSGNANLGTPSPSAQSPAPQGRDVAFGKPLGEPISIGDFSDFDDVFSDGEVPFN
jgi:single-strand DNA-binding protein